jgi:hypothetical protein
LFLDLNGEDTSVSVLCNFNHPIYATAYLYSPNLSLSVIPPPSIGIHWIKNTGIERITAKFLEKVEGIRRAMVDEDEIKMVGFLSSHMMLMSLSAEQIITKLDPDAINHGD